MTTIHLLGSEGFIGRAIQGEAGELLVRCWSHRKSESEDHFDLLDPSSWQPLLDSKPTHVILLSWPGLPNYHEPFHVIRNLPACLELIDKLTVAGLHRLVVAGTCYEYGLQNGPLREDQFTDPVNCYAIAKDALRRVIASRYSKNSLRWCWARIFYPFGNGQNSNSFLPSLQRAIDEGNPEFPMTSGRQIRDYMPVEQVAQIFLRLTVDPRAQGVYNCGSGNPVSLRELAEERIANFPSSPSLKIGVYPERRDEPLAFWADTSKIDLLGK